MGGWEIAIGVPPPLWPLYPLRSSRQSSPYFYYCCVGTFSFYPHRLSCPILAAAVLLLDCADAAEALLLSIILSPGTTPAPLVPGSPIFPSFPFRQTPDCSDILPYFFSPKCCASKIKKSCSAARNQPPRGERLLRKTMMSTQMLRPRKR